MRRSNRGSILWKLPNPAGPERICRASWTLTRPAGGFCSTSRMVAERGRARERMASEFRTLYDQPGFELEQIIPTPSPLRIIVGKLRAQGRLCPSRDVIGGPTFSRPLTGHIVRARSKKRGSRPRMCLKWVRSQHPVEVTCSDILGGE